MQVGGEKVAVHGVAEEGIHGEASDDQGSAPEDDGNIAQPHPRGCWAVVSMSPPHQWAIHSRCSSSLPPSCSQAYRAIREAMRLNSAYSAVSPSTGVFSTVGTSGSTTTGRCRCTRSARS